MWRGRGSGFRPFVFGQRSHLSRQPVSISQKRKKILGPPVSAYCQPTKFSVVNVSGFSQKLHFRKEIFARGNISHLYRKLDELKGRNFGLFSQIIAFFMSPGWKLSNCFSIRKWVPFFGALLRGASQEKPKIYWDGKYVKNFSTEICGLNFENFGVQNNLAKFKIY